MLQLILSLTVLFSGFSAHAFQDAKVKSKIVELKINLTAEPDAQRRMDIFENFRDFMFEHLQNYDAPETNGVDSERLSPQLRLRVEEYADLNEFQASIMMIRMKKVDKYECVRNWEKVTISGIIPYSEATPTSTVESTTRKTLEILELICGKNKK